MAKRSVEKTMISANHVRLRSDRTTVTLWSPDDREIDRVSRELTKGHRISPPRVSVSPRIVEPMLVCIDERTAIKFKRLTIKNIDLPILSPHFPYGNPLRMAMWRRGLFVEDVALMLNESIGNVMYASWTRQSRIGAADTVMRAVESQPMLSDNPSSVCVMRVWSVIAGETYGIPCMLYAMVDAPEDSWVPKAKMMLAVLNSAAERI